MRSLPIHFGAAAFVAFTSWSAPLDQHKVARDAKWVLHLDMDAFRQSRVGTYVVNQLLEPKLEAAEHSRKLNLSLSLTNISSLTAYGLNYEKNGAGVLLMESSADVKSDLDGLVALSSLSTESGKKVEILPGEPCLIYSLNGDLYVAPNVAHTTILAKSREQILRAREVLTGGKESLALNTAFHNYPDCTNHCFFVAMAEGFNQIAPIPPQAQVLKEARGGRVRVGERGDNLFFDLAFKGKNAESCTNISQILQGLVALVRITQPDKDAAEIANSAHISIEDRNVNVRFEFPVSKAISRIQEKESGPK
jgi:hypothetical protein